MSQKRVKRERQAARADGDRRIHDFMLNMAKSLQRQWRNALPSAQKRVPTLPPPCTTCAINPGTNGWEGMERTTLRLAAALLEMQPFYCHDGAPFDEEHGWAVDPKTAPMCAAFATLAAINLGDPEKVIRQAFADASGHPDAVDSDAVREGVGKLLAVHAMERASVQESPVK